MISCKDYAALKKEELKTKIDEHIIIRPYLSVIQIGDDPASNSYIKGKQRDCEEVGIFLAITGSPLIFLMTN